jgi:hypothetical protein
MEAELKYWLNVLCLNIKEQNWNGIDPDTQV